MILYFCGPYPRLLNLLVRYSYPNKALNQARDLHSNLSHTLRSLFNYFPYQLRRFMNVFSIM